MCRMLQTSGGLHHNLRAVLPELNRREHDGKKSSRTRPCAEGGGTCRVAQLNPCWRVKMGPTENRSKLSSEQLATKESCWCWGRVVCCITIYELWGVTSSMDAEERTSCAAWAEWEGRLITNFQLDGADVVIERRRHRSSFFKLTLTGTITGTLRNRIAYYLVIWGKLAEWWLSFDRLSTLIRRDECTRWLMS